MCVYVQSRTDLDDGDSWQWSILAVSSPWCFISLMQPTVAKTLSVYLAKSQMCLSYWYVGCIGKRWSARCRWSGEMWQCWATESTVASHARPRQLRHISILHSHDECDKHLAQWRSPRITHWGSGHNAGGCDGDGKNLFSSHCIVSHRGYPWSLPPILHTFYTASKSNPHIQHQPTCAVGQSVGHAVENGRPARPSGESANITQFA